MEIIRKKISIECARSRQQGLLPYIKYNDSDTSKHNVTSANTDGNYGNFAYNIKKSGTGINFKTEEVNYMDIIYRYNKIIKILEDGLKLKYIGNNKWTNNFEITETFATIDLFSIEDKSNIKATKSEYLFEYNSNNNYQNGDLVNFIDSKSKLFSFGNFFNANNDYEKIKSFVKFVDEKLIGKLNIPYNIEGAKVPEFLCYCDIKEWLDWFKKHEKTYSTDCCVKQEWEDRGGKSMYEFLSGNIQVYSSALKEVEKIVGGVPYINVPIILSQKIENIGIMTADLTSSENIKFLSSDKLNYGFGIITADTQDVTYSETRLSGVRSNRKYYDDNGDLLDMLLYSDDGCATLYDASYVKKEDNTHVLQNPKTFSYPYQIKEIVGLSYNRYYDINGEALKKIDNNGYTEMRGNIITNIDTSINGYVTLEYVIGAVIKAKIKANSETLSGNTDDNLFTQSGTGSTQTNFEFVSYDKKDIEVIKETGIKYKETYKLISNSVKTIKYNGVEITLTGTFIDYESNKQKVYSEDLGLYRDTSIAQIIDYTKADAFKPSIVDKENSKFYYIEDDTKECDIGKIIDCYKSYDVPIYKEDSLNGITASIIEKVDVSIDRGRANAFETHYKLSECSTFEDLENYGNNYFNL